MQQTEQPAPLILLKKRQNDKITEREKETLHKVLLKSQWVVSLSKSKVTWPYFFFRESKTGHNVNWGVRHLVCVGFEWRFSFERFKKVQIVKILDIRANLVAVCTEHPINVYIPHCCKPLMILFGQEEITSDAHVRERSNPSSLWATRRWLLNRNFWDKAFYCLFVFFTFSTTKVTSR